MNIKNIFKPAYLCLYHCLRLVNGVQDTAGFLESRPFRRFEADPSLAGSSGFLLLQVVLFFLDLLLFFFFFSVINQQLLTLPTIIC